MGNEGRVTGTIGGERLEPFLALKKTILIGSCIHYKGILVADLQSVQV